MDKAVRIFRSFKDAERAEKEYYQSLSPEQRLEILFELCAQYPHEAAQGLARVYRVTKLQKR